MPETIYRLIPCSPDTVIPREIAASAVQFLKKELHAEDAAYVVADSPMFVDCGTSLHKISCPHCHHALPFHWWAERMGESADTGFSQRSVTFPCCKKTGRLEDIDYEDPCGLARVVLEVKSPQNCPDTEALNTLQMLMGCDLREVIAKY